VALVARGAGALLAAEAAIRANGGDARAFPADITSPPAVGLLKAEVDAVLGRPSIVVNAAGVFGPIAPVRDGDPARWIETIQVNLIGAYLVCRACVGGMVDAGWGRIVNVGSAASLPPPGPLTTAYTTSKAALNHLTRGLAAETAGTGVTANVIHPGEVKTEMWADIRDQSARLGAAGESGRRWAQWVAETGGDPPGKAAALVVALMSDEAASTTGQFLWIEGGLQDPIPSW
jgi:3-oxoacyl-[acyl-carrier protein] reductase